VDLDAYRSSAESFTAELTLEYYRHFAGLTDSFELEPIYDRHEALFTHAAADELRRRLDAASPGGDDRRRLEILFDFAVEGLVGNATKELEEELAEREASLTIELGGEELGFRRSSVAQANEAQAIRRQAIHAARMAATEGSLNPLHRELVDARQAVSRELGFVSYRELCEVTKRLDLPALHAQTEAFRAATDESLHRVLAGPVARTPGLDGELRRADIPRFSRSPQLDATFPPSGLIESFTRTLAALGIDPDTRPGVVFDIDARPNKSPRAFCCPVRPPDEVYLVISPAGGWDDYGALFHEGGHTEHYAHVERSLAFEYRHLGDNAITECFAFLMQHLLESPVWLERVHGCTDPEPIVTHARAQKLLLLRRYTAKLSYELELHAGTATWAQYAARYAELLGGAHGMRWDPESYLADVDPGYYCAAYLRAWTLEANLRRHLIEHHGPAWFLEPEAAAELRALWREGQRYTAEELLHRLTGGTLDFSLLLADVGLA
jgi:hypothetical protein